MNNNLLGQILSIITYIFLQVFFLRNLVLFDISFCFIYISILLLLEKEWSAISTMLLGFFVGFVIDIFYGTIGIHTSACVFAGYMRQYVLDWTAPGGGYETWMQPRLNIMGFSWFATYASLLVLLHHTWLFLVENASFHLLGFTFIKIVASTLLTLTLSVIFQYTFYTKKASRF